MGQWPTLGEPTFLAHTATSTLECASCCLAFLEHVFFQGAFITIISVVYHRIFHYEMHLHILFTSNSFPTAKTIAFWANMHMDDLQIHSTLFLKLAFSWVPVLFLNCEFSLPCHNLSHVSVMPKITILFFLFLLGTCLRLPHREPMVWHMPKLTSWLLFTSFLSEAGAVYSAQKLPISFKERFVMQDNCTIMQPHPGSSFAPGVLKILCQSSVSPYSFSLLMHNTSPLFLSGFLIFIFCYPLSSSH